jgi:hypothetical protein
MRNRLSSISSSFRTAASFTGGFGNTYVRRLNVIVKAGQLAGFHGLLEDLFQGFYHAFVFTCDKCESFSGIIDPSGAADTMSIGVRGIRHIVVEDMRNAEDIQSAGSDIGSAEF